MATLTWADDDTPSLEGEFDDVSPVSEYIIEFRRNGGSWTEIGPSPITDDNSANYQFSVQRGVGDDLARAARVDGYYEMRVSEAGDGTVYWTDETYSPPSAPVAPSISRSDGETISIEWTTESEAAAGGPAAMAVDVQVAAVDDQGNAGSWQYLRRAYQADLTQGDISTVGSTLGLDIAVGEDYGGPQQTTLSRGTTYRVRLRHVIFDGEGPKASQWVFGDYGTRTGHIETSGFETGDLSSWSGQTTTPGDSGVISGAPPRAPTHLPDGPAEGSYYWYGNEGAVLRKYIGDLSGQTGQYIIRLRAAVATQVETVYVEWRSDGSWTQIYEFGAEFNATGWQTHHIPIPDSLLGSGCEFRITCGANSFDFGLIDSVVFGDVTEEDTSPEDVTGLDAETTETEISVTWDATPSYPTRLDFQYRQQGGSWTSTTGIGVGSTSHTESLSVDAGTIYEVRIQALKSQYRRGSFDQFFRAYSAVVETGYLPPPSDIVITAKSATTVSIAWTPADAGETEQLIYHSRDGGDSYTVVGSVTPSETTFMDTGLLNGERYTFTVASSTSWATSREDDGTVTDPSTDLLAGLTLGEDSLGRASFGDGN